MTLQVHDELVFEVPTGVGRMRTLVREQMENVLCAFRAAGGGYGSWQQLARPGVAISGLPGL